MFRHHNLYALLTLLALFGSRVANAQFTFHDFKVDNSTSLKVFIPGSSYRTATFSVKVAQNSPGTAEPTMQLYLVDSGNGFPARTATSVVWNSPTAQWMYDPALGKNSRVYTGRFSADDFSLGNGVPYANLQMGFTPSGTSTVSYTGPKVSINRVNIPPNTAGMTLTNFRVEGGTTVDVNPSGRTVSYSVTVNKDIAYSEQFYIRVYKSDINGSRGAEITSAVITTSDASQPPVGQNPGTAYTSKIFTKSFGISTAGMSSTDTHLLVLASSLNNYLLGQGANLVRINPVPDPVACNANVFLQNRTTWNTLTINSGGSIFAGSNVNSSAPAGPVTIGAGITVNLDAVQEISLQDGFSAVEGAYFQANIASGICTSSTTGFGPEDPEGRPASVAVMVSPQPQQKSAPTLHETRTAMSVYPNPAKDYLTVQGNGTESQQAVTIYNSFGVPVQRATLQPGATRIDVLGLKPGIYYLKAEGQAPTRFSVER